MHRTGQASIAILLALACIPVCGQETGAAAVSPWSGYWWPHREGGLVAPLTKYDQLLSTKAASWEQVNHVAPALATADSEWWGYCHAWSAASVSEKEPQKAVKVQGIDFSSGDQKGLLCACHAQDASNFYGDRYAGPGDDRNDLKPDALWRVLQLYLGRDRIPVILDLDADTQVWNYPVYQYRVDHEPGADGWTNCVLQLLVAEDNVPAEYVGTRAALHTYTFRVRMENGAVVDGTGEWTGESANDHPDFAWYPQVAQAENPEIDIAKVAKILGHAVGGENPPVPDPAPPTPDTPPPTPGAGDSGTGPEVNVPPAVLDSNPVPPAPPVQFSNLLSPQELLELVSSTSSSFKFNVTVEGGDGAKFDAGKPIRVSGVSSQKGYLYLFDIGPSGELSLVFPIGNENNEIQKDTRFDIPAAGKDARLIARGHGQHDLKSIVLTSPLTLTGFESPSSNRPAPGKQDPPATENTKVSAPLPLRVCTTTQRRVRGRLLNRFRKGIEDEAVVPEKVENFSQDSTSYFVFEARKTEASATQSPGNQTNQKRQK